jgi:hypothetical protein
VKKREKAVETPPVLILTLDSHFLIWDENDIKIEVGTHIELLTYNGRHHQNKKMQPVYKPGSVFLITVVYQKRLSFI